MSLQEEFDKQKRDLDKGYEDDKDIVKSMTPWPFRRREGEVTAATIKQEAEKPIHNAAELLLLRGRMKYAATGNRFLRNEAARNKQYPFRTGEVIDVTPVKPKTNKTSIWDRIFNEVPTSESQLQQIQKTRINNGISVSEATGIVDNNFKNNLVNPIKNYADSAAYLFGGGLGIGTGVPSNTFSGGDDQAPEPEWNLTPRPDEKLVWRDRFADEVLFNATGKHIAQRIEGGYKFLSKFRTEWNKWSRNTGFIREVSDKPATAYVEHLTGKDKYYDRFWSLPDNLRFRKGSRHSPNNVRILYSNRMKSFKDASETILKSLYNPEDPMNLLLFDWDIPKMKGRSITVKQSPRDLLLRRVDGTIVGRLGDYHDILYASDNPKLVGKKNTLSYRLGTNINPKTNKPYINLNTTPENIAEQITKWREAIIREKIEFIVNEAPTLKDYKTKAAKWEYQGSAIEQDMVEFLTEYSFIEPPKGFRTQLKQDSINSPRGGKPIEYRPPTWKNKLK